ncbi:MAG: hypothetical protein PUE85_00055 [Firmicutes bacterium]|nr:hypothetical protein [Bacillota bacterium]
MEMLYTDKTELIYTDITKPDPPSVNIPYTQIATIFYGVTTVKKLFGLIKKDVKCITIKSTSSSEYKIFESDVGKETYEKYLEMLTDFAKRNRITMKESAGSNKDDWKL